MATITMQKISLLQSLRGQDTLGIAISEEKDILQLKMGLFKVQKLVTLATAVKAKHLREVSQNLGEEEVLKILVLVIKCFVDSVKVKNKISPFEMIELAQHLLSEYFAETLEDFILAFKEAKFSGQNFYQSLGTEEIMGIVGKYLNKKAEYLEEESRIKYKNKLDDIDFASWVEETKNNPLVKEAMLQMAEIGGGYKHKIKMKLINQKYENIAYNPELVEKQEKIEELQKEIYNLKKTIKSQK